MSDPIAAIHKIQQDEYSRVPLSAYQLFVRKPRGERDDVARGRARARRAPREERLRDARVRLRGRRQTVEPPADDVLRAVEDLREEVERIADRRHERERQAHVAHGADGGWGVRRLLNG